MKPEMSSQQPARLLPETVMAIDKYRRDIKRETGKTPSINASINALILIGYNTHKHADPAAAELARERKMNEEAAK